MRNVKGLLLCGHQVNYSNLGLCGLTKTDRQACYPVVDKCHILLLGLPEVNISENISAADKIFCS